MLNRVLHAVVYAAFEVYLFVSYWFLRVTFLDYLVEYIVLRMFEKAGIRVVWIYRSYDQQLHRIDLIEKKITPSMTIYDRRLFAKIAAYPSLGFYEGFLVSVCEQLF